MLSVNQLADIFGMTSYRTIQRVLVLLISNRPRAARLPLQFEITRAPDYSLKTRVKRRTSHEPNRMQMRKTLCSPLLSIRFGPFVVRRLTPA